MTRYVCDHLVATNEKFVATVAGHFDFSGKGELFKFLLPLADERPNNPALYANLHDQLDSQSFGAWLSAALAVIKTPRLTDLHEELNTKLNAQRERKGKPALLSYAEVGIKVDAGISGIGKDVANRGPVALHHLRSHLRLRRGRIELVRPHMRGSPSAGVLKQRHIVRSVEDEGGDWKGEPLPSPTLLRKQDASE